MLTMREYIAEMRPEVEAVIERLWREHRKAQDLEATIQRAQCETTTNYKQVECIIADPYLDDDDGIATLLYWETYFGSDKIQHDARLEKSTLEDQLSEHSIARANSSGALLQYAKQAISQSHGKHRDNAPVGCRMVAGEYLRDVIWEGRNQSEHWDEGQFSSNVNKVFRALESHFHGRFGDYETCKNKAFDVVDILGWRDWPAFERDLLSLG